MHYCWDLITWLRTTLVWLTFFTISPFRSRSCTGHNTELSILSRSSVFCYCCSSHKFTTLNNTTWRLLTAKEEGNDSKVSEDHQAGEEECSVVAETVSVSQVRVLSQWRAGVPHRLKQLWNNCAAEIQLIGFRLVVTNREKDKFNP